VLWVADITYLRSWEGWVYLAAVQDAYSRRIVGWAMADHMRSELVVAALGMALARRRPAPGLVHHFDQGGQFVSLAFGQSAEAGTLDGRDVHEHILAAIARLNETETLLTVEPLHCSRSHFLFSKARWLLIPRGDRTDSNPFTTMSLEEAP
jgi:hypothetical protein